MLGSYMHMNISWPNLVGSDISRYLRNQESTPDISKHIIWPMHTSQHACKVYSGVLWSISLENRPLKSVHLIIFEDIYKIWTYNELWIVISMKCLFQIQIMKTAKQFKVDVTISPSISLVQTLTSSLIKKTNCEMYMHYTVQLYCTL